MNRIKKFKIDEVIDYLEKENKTKEEKRAYSPEGFSYPLGFGRGMEGFSMKAFLIPESIHILVCPVGCGRHSDMDFLANGVDPSRIYRIWLTENDIVVGAAGRVKTKVMKLVESLEQKPKAVTLNITCLDALLNTDYSVVGRELETKYGIRFGFIRMFPFLQESKKTHGMMLMEFQYSLIHKPQKRQEKLINLIGNTLPLSMDSDFIKILGKAGYRVIEIRNCKTIEEYDQMGAARLNVVLNKHTVPAARMMEQKYGVPYIEFCECMDPDQIRKNYEMLESELEEKLDYESYYEKAAEKKKEFSEIIKGKTAAVGSCFDYNSVKCAAEMAKLGMTIKYIWVTEFLKKDLPYYKTLKEQGQDSVLYLMTDYSMKDWKIYEDTKVDLVIGLISMLMMGIYEPTYLFLDEEPFDFETFIGTIERILYFVREGNSFGSTKTESTVFDRDWGMFPA